MKKTRAAFRPCNVTGCVDALREDFPVSNSGTNWAIAGNSAPGAVTALTAEGLVSMSRTVICGKPQEGGAEPEARRCNVLRGRVPRGGLPVATEGVACGGGVGMSLPLSNAFPEGSGEVDCRAFSGLEVDVYCPRGLQVTTVPRWVRVHFLRCRRPRVATRLPSHIFPWRAPLLL